MSNSASDQEKDIYDLPDDILLTLMIDMPKDELLKFAASSKKLRDLYKREKEYIYREKLSREFYTSTEKLYELFILVKRNYPDLIKSFHIREAKPSTDCKDILEYFDKTSKFMNTVQIRTYLGDRKSVEYRTNFIITIYGHATRCIHTITHIRLLQVMSNKIDQYIQDLEAPDMAQILTEPYVKDFKTKMHRYKNIMEKRIDDLKEQGQSRRTGGRNKSKK